ncbi:MAG: putative porin, partial [Bacteroidota bacterium]
MPLCLLVRCVLLLILAISPLWLRAQITDPGDPRNFNIEDPDYDVNAARRPGPQQQRAEVPDTFGIFAFQVANPNEELAFSDSLLTGWQVFDPSREVAFDYGTVGILGGAAYPLRYTPRLRRGVDIGLHQFDLYQVTGENLDFYRLERPYTQLEFVRGSEQRDFYVTTKFSRNFADGVNFTLDYRRNSQRGRNDQFPNQNLRNTNLATGFWIDNKRGKYDAFISYAANTYEQNQNGGLTILPDLNVEFSSPISAEVYLEDGFIRQSHREWM